MHTTRPPSVADDLPEPGQAVEVIALGRNGASICGRLRVGAMKVLVRAGLSPFRAVEGELFTLDVSRRTRECGFWRLDGSIRAPRFNATALRLEPLALITRPTPGPVAEGSEREFELETIIPRVPNFRAAGQAAVDEIAALWEAEEWELAELLAGELLARDLRCLEAHALLGGFFLSGPVEQRWTERALRHYRVGARIGEMSLGGSFEGRLPWRWAGNRAFLRCLYGYGRCLERVGDAGPAREVFRRLLELDPDDPMEVSDRRL